MILNVYVPGTHEPEPPQPTSTLPVFTYTGDYKMEDEGMDGDTQNWTIRFLTSGTLKFKDFGGAESFDVFLCGGGGAGARGGQYNGQYYFGGQGGGGGYTYTKKGFSLELGKSYAIEVGEGGAAVSQTVNQAASGEASTAFGYTANGGEGGGQNTNNAAIFGDGGNGGGVGGYNGAVTGNGVGGYGGGIDGLGGQDGGFSNSGIITVTGHGQTTKNTHEFKETARKMYGCGGSGAGGWRSNSSFGKYGAVYSVSGDKTKYAGHGAGGNPDVTGAALENATSAGANTGGGGGGSNANAQPGIGYVPGSGGSGIVCVRNHR